MPTTLYDYYKEKGQSIPSVADRAPLAKQHGIENYTGTAEQNSALLAKLSSGTAADLPPNDPITPAGGGSETQDNTMQTVGELGNLRVALRSALNEAARKRVENNFKAVAPGTGNTPGTMGSVVDLIRGGVKSSAETTFSDIMTGYKDASDNKQKEMDRINELRLEFGSAVPSTVTDLKTALDLVAPLVDKERRDKLAKLSDDQATDDSIESFADCVAKGGSFSQCGVPAKLHAAVRISADKIQAKLESDAKQEYKDRIVFRIEQKTSDFNTEKGLVTQDDNLSVAEQREMIDYLDGLEEEQKASKQKASKPLPGNTTTSGVSTPSASGVNPFNVAPPLPSNKLFGDNFVAPLKSLYNK